MRRILPALCAMLLLAACGAPHPSAGGSVHPPGWGRPIPHAHHLLLAVPQGVMWDTVTRSALPANPFALAGYTSGLYTNYLAFRARYPRAHTISIAISAAHHADCLDVEPGDATPAQAPGWVKADRAAGFGRPCVYSSIWMFLHQVIPDLRAAGIARSSVLEWDADYSGRPGLDVGFDATQFTDRALGRNLDESSVTLAFLTVAQPPYHPPAPAPAVICWGRRAQPRNRICEKVRPELARYSRARASSRKALGKAEHDLRARRCRRPYRRNVCVHDARSIRVLSQRARYFDRRARALFGRYT